MVARGPPPTPPPLTPLVSSPTQAQRPQKVRSTAGTRPASPHAASPTSKPPPPVSTKLKIQHTHPWLTAATPLTSPMATTPAPRHPHTAPSLSTSCPLAPGRATPPPAVGLAAHVLPPQAVAGEALVRVGGVCLYVCVRLCVCVHARASSVWVVRPHSPAAGCGRPSLQYVCCHNITAAGSVITNPSPSYTCKAAHIHAKLQKYTNPRKAANCSKATPIPPEYPCTARYGTALLSPQARP